MDGCIDKENVVYRCNGVLFSLKKGNPVICNNIDKLEGHYTVWKSLVKEAKFSMILFIWGI